MTAALKTSREEQYNQLSTFSEQVDGRLSSIQNANVQNIDKRRIAIARKLYGKLYTLTVHNLNIHFVLARSQNIREKLFKANLTVCTALFYIYQGVCQCSEYR